MLNGGNSTSGENCDFLPVGLTSGQLLNNYSLLANNMELDDSLVGRTEVSRIFHFNPRMLWM
jgi:hypothetical protein